MFTEKKIKEPIVVSERNVIGKNTSIIGDVKAEGDFRIDGCIEGTIKTSGRVVIGALGCVKGNIECENSDIEGSFSGNLAVNNLLSLKASAKINGEVVIGKLSVEPGAEFNATCAIKSSVKELNNEQTSKEKSA